LTLTVFIGTFNRLDTLSRTVASYRNLTTPHELVIVDNGTDDPDALKLLAELERLPEVRKVYQLSKIDSMQELTDNYNVAVSDQYKTSRRRDWFAITDADICFDGSSPRSLDAYLKVARATGLAVGPHLRVDAGIPRGYPLRHRVLATEARLLYRDSMTWLKKIPYSVWPIDTTFHLFPAERTFRRLKMTTLRVGPPFDAMHLDWYLDVFNPTPENGIYVNASSTIGAWGRTWIAHYWQHFQREGPEAAFELIRDAPRNDHDDLCITSFVLSWCLEVGAGCTPDREASVRELHAAIPCRFEDFWANEEDWMAMIYDNDFSCLGWAA
jgi:hypothetical protein